MADGGVSEAALLIAAEEAATIAAAEAAAAAAASAGTTAAGASAAAYGAGALGAGEAAAGAYGGLTATELAALEGTAAAGAGGLTPEAAALLAQEGAASGATGEGLLGSMPYGAGDTMSIANQPAPMSDFQLYKEAAQNGFRNLGKMQKDLPPGVSNMAMQGLLGSPKQGEQTNITPPRPQGPPSNPQPTAGLLGQQPLPKVTPYAPSLGGQDAEEMKRRLMLMMQGFA